MVDTKKHRTDDGTTAGKGQKFPTSELKTIVNRNQQIHDVKALQPLCSKYNYIRFDGLCRHGLKKNLLHAYCLVFVTECKI